MSLYLCLCLSFCVSRYLCLSFSRTHIHIRSTASWARQHVRYTHIYLYMYTLSRSLSLSHTHTILIPKQRRDIARQMCDYYVLCQRWWVIRPASCPQQRHKRSNQFLGVEERAVCLAHRRQAPGAVHGVARGAKVSSSSMKSATSRGELGHACQGAALSSCRHCQRERLHSETRSWLGIMHWR